MLISQSELARRLGVERLTVYRWYKSGKLPKQVVKNKNKLGWDEDTLNSFFSVSTDDLALGYAGKWFGEV